MQTRSIRSALDFFSTYSVSACLYLLISTKSITAGVNENETVFSSVWTNVLIGPMGTLWLDDGAGFKNKLILCIIFCGNLHPFFIYHHLSCTGSQGSLGKGRAHPRHVARSSQGWHSQISIKFYLCNPKLQITIWHSLPLDLWTVWWRT